MIIWLIQNEWVFSAVAGFETTTYQLQVQWAPLTGITDNEINWLMGSNVSRLTSANYSFQLNVTVIIISRLLESVCLRPKVVPLSCFHCILPATARPSDFLFGLQTIGQSVKHWKRVAKMKLSWNKFEEQKLTFFFSHKNFCYRWQG
jgi:hypothetical protein